MMPPTPTETPGPVLATSATETGRTPRIGITTYVETAQWGVWQRPVAMVTTTYTDIVKDSGAVPVLLPPALGLERAALDGVDALVVAGGPDVDPARYGAPRHPRTGTAREERDSWELALLAEARRREMPVLAVCRGMQLLNVLYGGTLHQHLPEVLGGEPHQPAPATFGETRVQVLSGSTLQQLVGPEVNVHCYHHQALADIGAGLTVSAVADDGTVEAVEDRNHPFLLGVQWHPEEDATDLRLFQGLRNACIESPKQHQQRKVSA